MKMNLLCSQLQVVVRGLFLALPHWRHFTATGVCFLVQSKSASPKDKWSNTVITAPWLKGIIETQIRK